MAFVLLTVELSVGVNLLIPGPWWHDPNSLTPLPRITSEFSVCTEHGWQSTATVNTMREHSEVNHSFANPRHH